MGFRQQHGLAAVTYDESLHCNETYGGMIQASGCSQALDHPPDDGPAAALEAVASSAHGATAEGMVPQTWQF